MKARSEDRKKIGIYCIYNKSNNKVYIGKSINIYKRIVGHISLLKRKDKKSENEYFINSWNKYGKNNFDYKVLEYFDKIDEKELNNKELFWITKYNSINSKFGYNLRRDSSTKCIIHPKTRIKYKIAGKKRMSILKNREILSKSLREFWKNNPDIKRKCQLKTSVTRTKYKILQYDKKTNKLIKIWDSVMLILQENPSYKRSNINSVLQGHKPTIYGYIWKYDK